jgi:hypothetical protein
MGSVIVLNDGGDDDDSWWSIFLDFYADFPCIYPKIVRYCVTFTLQSTQDTSSWNMWHIWKQETAHCSIRDIAQFFIWTEREREREREREAVLMLQSQLYFNNSHPACAIDVVLSHFVMTMKYLNKLYEHKFTEFHHHNLVLTVSLYCTYSENICVFGRICLKRECCV